MSGRVMLVTGGASGIGLATARLWQERGEVPVVFDLDAVPEDTGMCALRCDVRSEEDVRAGVAEVRERFGRLDAVFHNAGVLGREAEISTLQLTEWNDCLQTNLTGAFLIARETIPLLVRSAPSFLVFNSSIAAVRGASRSPAYAAAKAGVLSLARSLAVPLARKGVRVNAICPGSVVGTSFVAHSRGARVTPTEVATLLAQIPLRRTTKPADIAELVLFLVSAAASQITGAVIPVDGGESLASG